MEKSENCVPVSSKLHMTLKKKSASHKPTTFKYHAILNHQNNNINMLYLRSLRTFPFQRILRGFDQTSAAVTSSRQSHTHHANHTSPSPEEQLQIDSAQLWLDNLKPESIPKSSLDVKFIRSSGPGGQKVNKTSSKAMIHINGLNWIPSLVSSRLIQNGFRYLNKFNSGFTISDDTTRSREDNLEKCLEKFIAEMKSTVKFRGRVSDEDLEKWEKVKNNTNEARLKDKQRRSDKKNSRRESKNFEY